MIALKTIHVAPAAAALPNAWLFSGRHALGADSRAARGGLHREATPSRWGLDWWLQAGGWGGSQGALDAPASVCQFRELVTYSTGEWEGLRLCMPWGWWDWGQPTEPRSLHAWNRHQRNLRFPLLFIFNIGVEIHLQSKRPAWARVRPYLKN